MTVPARRKAKSRFYPAFKAAVVAWGQKNPGWISCEQICADVVRDLRSRGFDPVEVHGEARFMYEHSDGKKYMLEDFHVWVEHGAGRIYDPKSLLLRLRGFDNHRYWAYAPYEQQA